MQGTLKRGQLTLIDTKGNRTVYSYQVHVKDGETFWGEYFFNGYLYGRKFSRDSERFRKVRIPSA